MRQEGYLPGGAASPEERVIEWSGDHLADPTTLGPDLDGELGVDPGELTDDDLIREIHSLHRTRLDTLRHASDSALAHHLRRTAELETEYLARYPSREVDPSRLRDE